MRCLGSPVRDDGRGLKRFVLPLMFIMFAGSPVRDDGRGLKLAMIPGDVIDTGIARQR